MDNVDKILCILPFLAILDVISVLYVKSLGDPFATYRLSLFADFLSGTDLISIYVHVVVYLIVMFGLPLVLLYVKDGFGTSSVLGRVGLFTVATIAGALYVFLSEGFIINFFLRSVLNRGIDLFWLTTVVYLAAAFSVVFYIWNDLVSWVRPADARK